MSANGHEPEETQTLQFLPLQKNLWVDLGMGKSPSV